MRLLGGRIRRRDGAPLVDLVAGPTTGGVILAFETARQLGTRAIFAEEVRDADGGTRREFRRGFRIEPGERVLLVDDILTTGGSLLAMIPAVEALGGEIVECAVLVDRSGGHAHADVADDRAASTRSVRCGSSTCRRTSRVRRRARDAPTARRSTRRAAPAPARPRRPAPPERWIAAVRNRPRARLIVVTSVAAAAVLGGTGGPPPATTLVVGVVVAVDSAGLTEVRGLHAPRRRRPDARRSTCGALENGAEFPPGHLVEHQATAQPVRVWYRDARAGRVAIRLEDAPAGVGAP